jgi:hypothetical protein
MSDGEFLEMEVQRPNLLKYADADRFESIRSRGYGQAMDISKKTENSIDGMTPPIVHHSNVFFIGEFPETLQPADVRNKHPVRQTFLY